MQHAPDVAEKRVEFARQLFQPRHSPHPASPLALPQRAVWSPDASPARPSVPQGSPSTKP
jgi:hypothetical protein